MRSTLLFALLFLGTAVSADEAAQPGIPSSALAEPILYRRVEIPEPLLLRQTDGDEERCFGGDLRVGDLNGDGQADFLVYRSVDNAHDGGGMKPCFLGAFTMAGKVLWQVGIGGEQPCRPGPVAVHDIDGDGACEVVCFFLDPGQEAPPASMANVVVQIRSGATGEVERRAQPAALAACSGQGPNWCHQRILIANFRGTDTPRDFVIKLGTVLIAFDQNLDVLWTYRSTWSAYANCPAYIPAVGDIDGDGKDEVNGGYSLLRADGTPYWERKLGLHMDSVAITEWDNGHVRAICSGFGHVMDERGKAVLSLGEEIVPHGQEVRVARFSAEDPAPHMLIRYNAHTPEVILVNTEGETLRRFQLNPTPNNTGMEVIYWQGPGAPAALVNGSMLWDPATETAAALPGLPEPQGPHRSGWYHCIPADICGDPREEALLYNPWDRVVYVYTPAELDEAAYTGYRPTPRQYNARLMD